MASAQTPSAAELLRQAEDLAERGDWFHAGPLYAEAEQQFRASGDRRNEVYAMLGRLHRAAEAGGYRTVRDQIAGLLPDQSLSNDTALRIRALSILGTIDLNLDTEAAQQDWNEVLKLATVSDDDKWKNRARGQLALIAGLNGDMGGAGLALYQVIQKAGEIGDIAALVHFSVWLANGMTVNGMADRALPVLAKAEEAARKADREPSLQLMVAKIRALAGTTEPDKRRVDAQLSNLADATLDEARRKQTPGAQGEVLILWAKLLVDHARYSDAEPLANEALEVARRAALPREEAQALLLLSQIYRLTGRASRAVTTVEMAITAMQRVEEPYDLPRYIAEQAEVRAATGALRDADRLYSQAIDLVDGLLVNAPSSAVKSAMIASLGEIYIGHFRLAAERLNAPARAFTILESARGRALYDSIRYARRTKGTSGSSLAELDIARLQRSLLHQRLTPTQTKKLLAQLDRAYDKLNPIQYEKARAEMTMLRGAPVSASALMKRLDDGEVVIQYLLDARRSYAIRVQRSGISVHKLPPRREFSQLARKFVGAIRGKQEPGASAEALYRLALAPVLPSGVRSVTIVPDGPLHLVPFAALVDEAGQRLGSKVALASAPSATVYTTLRTVKRASATRSFLGVAFSPETGSATPAALARGILGSQGSAASPLAFAREEVSEAARAIGARTTVLAGADASEAALKAQPLQQFRVLHFVAHGVGNEREPDRAALLLAPGNAAEDGLWQAREIRETRLNADMVVLSACETGTGRLQGQEGVMNLARAFLAVGARSVVASLWSVDDRTTATLMGMFYERLARGETIRESLRSAQVQFVKEYGAKATPYHWAGFEVIGDGSQRIKRRTNETATTD